MTRSQLKTILFASGIGAFVVYILYSFFIDHQTVAALGTRAVIEAVSLMAGYFFMLWIMRPLVRE